jgi:hypothetical protein
MTRVYVYSRETDEQGLKSLTGKIGETIFWTAELSRFRVGKAFPDTWAEKGSVFSSTLEIRWQRKGDAFKILIISDRPLDGFLPEEGPKDGIWEAEEEKVFLQDLKEPRVNPQFKSYPDGEGQGMMRVMAVRRNGLPVAMSPRGIEHLLEEKL